MRKILTLVLAALFMVVGGAAFADEGANAPTPYTVTTEGVHLAEGDTFGHNDQVHIRYYSGGDSAWKDTKATGPEGQPFIPWADFGLVEGDQVVHVRLTIYTQHWNFEKGLPVQPRPEPGHEVRETYEEGEWEAIDMNCAAGEWTLERTNWTYAEYRESSFVWDPDTLWWSEVWGDWMLVESTDEIETKIETFDPAEEPACAEMPPTGAGQVAGLAGIALLTLIGGTFLVRRSKA